MKKSKQVRFRPRLCRWRCKCGVAGFAYDPVKEINAHLVVCEYEPPYYISNLPVNTTSTSSSAKWTHYTNYSWWYPLKGQY
jgi:hypothetical protein